MLAFSSSVSAKLNIPEQQVIAVLELLSEGATIPFIARYRKDRTGALDEVQIQNIQEEAKFQQEFSDRKLFIEKTITEQGKMTEALQANAAHLRHSSTGWALGAARKAVLTSRDEIPGFHWYPTPKGRSPEAPALKAASRSVWKCCLKSSIGPG